MIGKIQNSISFGALKIDAATQVTTRKVINSVQKEGDGAYESFQNYSSQVNKTSDSQNIDVLIKGETGTDCDKGMTSPMQFLTASIIDRKTGTTVGEPIKGLEYGKGGIAVKRFFEDIGNAISEKGYTEKTDDFLGKYLG